MQIYFTLFKIACSATFVLMLANCAGSVNDEGFSEFEESTIIITGSHIKRIEVETKKTARIARRQRNSPTSSSIKEIDSSTIEIEQLYKIIANSPSASHQIFKLYKVNPTIQTKHNPTSTFSMDVDNASFKLAANMLRKNQLPNPDGIRIEEFVNSMDYQYSQGEVLFSISAEAMPSPFRKGYHVLHIGLQTKELADHERNPSNIVFVADISGSMASDNKIDLLKDAMTTLISQLNSDDQIAIVVYNDTASIILDPTPVSNKRKIYKIISKLRTGGSTNAEKGIIMGYDLAEKMYQPGFNNRVILTSDGMANVGSRSPEQILNKISESKDKGIFLTTLGVGVGMYNDHLLEQLANKGNGNYLYIANQKDIQTSFVDELNSQLQTVAKDAKIQVNFDPKVVSNYRLLGYENRKLNKEDFTDSTKDGGEVGAGHTVTALYEIKLVGNKISSSNNIAKLSIAYKKPQGRKVHVLNKQIPLSVVRDNPSTVSSDSRLSFAVAAFAEKLRQSYWAKFYDYQDIANLLNNLPSNYKRQPHVQELLGLVIKAKHLDNRQDIYYRVPTSKPVNFDRVPLLD